MHGAVVAAKRDRPQSDRLDQARLAVDRDDVAEADLVLQDQEEAGDDVANEVLRAKADGQAGDPGARQDRTNVHVEEGECHQSRDADHEQRRHHAEQLTEGVHALLALEQVLWVASRETRKICRLSIRKWMHRVTR